MDKLLTTVSFIQRWAPWCNLIVPVGIILTLGYFHFLYMDAILAKNLGTAGAFVVGSLLWALIAGARIAALFATVSDFSQGDMKGGWLGLTVSIALLAFDLWFIGKISLTYGESGAILSVFLRFCSGLATAMEARLVLLILDINGTKYQGVGRRVQIPQTQTTQTTPIPQQRPLVQQTQNRGTTIAGNGNGSNHNF